MLVKKHDTLSMSEKTWPHLSATGMQLTTTVLQPAQDLAAASRKTSSESTNEARSAQPAH